MTETTEKQMMCIGCGYLLVNLPTQRCPECGRWFNPSDASTFLTSDKRIGWRKHARPPSKLQCFIFASLSFYGLLNASGPAQWGTGSICMAAFVGAPIWFGLLFSYALRALMTWYDRERAALDIRKRRNRWRWSVVPICATLVISSWVYPWPLLLRFRLSQSAFEAAVKNYQAGVSCRGQWVGLYHVKDVSRTTYSGPAARTTIGFMTGSSIIDPVGFEYDPMPNHPTGYMRIEVADSWYTYED